MDKRKFFLAVFAVILGIIIFAASLFTYSDKAGSGVEKVSKKKFYLNGKILPDHIIYPGLMILDRTLIAISDDEAKMYLKIRLAQDRMISAQKLLQKGEEVLALTTLTKSQKYLILAIHEYISVDKYPTEIGVALYNALQDNTSNLSRSVKGFSIISTDPVKNLITESNTLLILLENKIRE